MISVFLYISLSRSLIFPWIAKRGTEKTRNFESDVRTRERERKSFDTEISMSELMHVFCRYEMRERETEERKSSERELFLIPGFLSVSLYGKQLHRFVMTMTHQNDQNVGKVEQRRSVDGGKNFAYRRNSRKERGRQKVTRFLMRERERRKLGLEKYQVLSLVRLITRVIIKVLSRYYQGIIQVLSRDKSFCTRGCWVLSRARVFTSVSGSIIKTLLPHSSSCLPVTFFASFGGEAD